MKLSILKYLGRIVALGFLGSSLLIQNSSAQFIMDDFTDTTKHQSALFAIYKQSDRLRFSGYIQPQFQIAQSKGAPSYNGGDFPEGVNNRFMIRRGRIRFDYSHFNKKGQQTVFFVFQFDGTERGVFIRDFFGQFYENKWGLLNFTTGIFPRPFGYEVNLSSASRESPERGRMSQILMRTERDLGARVSFEAQEDDHPLDFLRVDLGVFNGQGLTATTDFDSHKDLIGRVMLKPRLVWPKVVVSAGTSVLYGGMEQFTNEIYRMERGGYRLDTSPANIGKIAPRHYYGGDIQIKFLSERAGTEFRAEYISGTQTSTRTTSETPGEIPELNNGQRAPLFIRPFNGAYFYFLQTLFRPEHQLVLKYDWYDPNTGVAGSGIGEGYTGADVAFRTLGMGYNYYATDNLRFLLYYDIVKNEKTALEGYRQDLRDNIFTMRVQYSF
ncbi:porin [Telluribacter sp. SYSU D00476]|uniref:porin n=1 Tax=Telluribacter sp. SYSU D00476 TaxID=2811430 RepID=UPI001FF559C6|nr:porin [Telluribacter sp. SYSU D00476]